jgi:hypothetical protein
MPRITTVLALALAASACVSTVDDPHDPMKRQPLFDSVKALEGTWEKKGPEGQTMVTEFKVSSAGSVVREIMFPGTDHEMTNVYALDGNALKVTHYCAMGNQPEMLAVARVGNQLRFHVVGVSDMEAPDEMYMGGLTLEFVDQDHLTEHWRSYVKNELQTKDAADFAFTRRK